MTFKIRRDEKIKKSVETYLDKWSRGAQLKRKNVFGNERKLHCFMFRDVVVGWEETGQHVSYRCVGSAKWLRERTTSLSRSLLSVTTAAELQNRLHLGARSQ